MEKWEDRQSLERQGGEIMEILRRHEIEEGERMGGKER